MLEISSLKKNKVNLTDYPCQLDVENRIMLADFTEFEHRVLEEILFSSLKISLKKFCQSIGCLSQDLAFVFDKLIKSGLLAIEGDTLSIDKDMRKYFECQIARFDPDFKPDMEFIQGLLRKVPIHVLPSWYAIPRTSSNIFESILEKYLLTPQIFTRYLAELQLGDSKVHAILRDVYKAPLLQISSSDLIAKYNLSRYEFEEMIILLEFHFVCCLSYKKEDDHWIEVVTPFYEWRQYLLHLQSTEAPNIASDAVRMMRDSEFAFVEDLSRLLLHMQTKPVVWDASLALPVDLTRSLASEIGLHPLTDLQAAQKYLGQLIKKAHLVKLAEMSTEGFRPTESSIDWLQQSLEKKAAYLHRHPLNHITSFPIEPTWNTDKHIYEAEKSLRRVLHSGWVYFDDFIQGVTVSLDEHSQILLKKTGKSWRYTLPQYTNEQKDLFKAVVFEWLFEAGMVSIGTAEKGDCFQVTDFGRCFF